MTTLRCDGCWREEKVTESWTTLQAHKGDRWDGYINLCPSCAERFEAFLKSLREEPL